MILLGTEILHQIIAHAKRVYPEECCGIMMGLGNLTRSVKEIYPVPNINTERAHDRYEIAPEDFFKADGSAREKGLEIIGFYHSHPSHPPIPSAFDKQNAWPEYSYFIISIGEDRETTLKSWMFDEIKGVFEEEEVQIVD